MMMFEDNNNSGSEDDVFSKEGRRLTLRQVLNNDFQSKQQSKAFLLAIIYLTLFSRINFRASIHALRP